MNEYDDGWEDAIMEAQLQAAAEEEWLHMQLDTKEPIVPETKSERRERKRAQRIYGPVRHLEGDYRPKNFLKKGKS